jgi:TonB-dependent receptor
MRTTLLKNTYICFLLLFGIIALNAQNGNITGFIFDQSQKSTLPGASIYLKSNLSIGTISELDGKYTLVGVPVGNDTIVVSYTGYEDLLTPVTIEANKTTTLDLTIVETSLGLEEVVISAQALGQQKAINQQLNADQIANIVSADKIKELPDVNAAEAISRLPGVAINRSGGEGSKVVIRGLDPKFTAITVNGARLPSTSPNDRSVDLSLISPELLSGIELFKSPTPDMDGDAIGGTVNLNITRAPKVSKISVKGLGGHNALAKTTNDYKFTTTMSTRVLDSKLGVILSANAERFNRSAEIVNQSWSDDLKVVEDSLLNKFAQQGNALTFNKSLEKRYRQNGSMALDYQIGSHTDINILGLYSRTSRDRNITQEQYNVAGNNINMRGQITNSSIELLSTSASIRHKFNLVEIDYGFARSNVMGETPNSHELEFRSDRSAFVPAASSSRQDPFAFHSFISSKKENEYLQRLYYSNSSNQEINNTYYLNLNLNLIRKNNLSLSFKTGTKYFGLEKERFYEEFRTDRGYYLFQNTHFKDFLPEGGLGARGVDPSGNTYYSMHNFTKSDNILSLTGKDGVSRQMLSSFDFDKINRFVNIYKKKPETLKNFYSDTDIYNLRESVFGNYAMFKLKVGNTLTVIPGIRYEISDNEYFGRYTDLSGDLGQVGTNRKDSAKVDYGLLLPHLHIKYKPKEWFDIRASYSTTVARPDYNYLIPFTNIDRSSDLQIEQGVPTLKPSVSRNYDLFFTAYSGKYGLISVGGFYKDIENAFYPFTAGLNTDTLAEAFGFPKVGFVGADLRTFRNSAKSSVNGIEFEYQSNLNFLPGFFKNFVLTFNYARLFSQTNIFSFREETVIKRIPPFTIIRQIFVFPFEREADLIGQAKHILNTSLGYDFNKFSIRGSAAYQGSKLTGYSAAADKDRYSQEFWRFDIALKQKIGDNISLYLNVNNISDQNDVSFFRNPRFETNRERYGSTITFGAEYILK